jgi:hypothetical protein
MTFLFCLQRESNALYEKTTLQRVKLLTAEVLRRKRHINDLRLAEVGIAWHRMACI